jgi:heme exporter protein A
MENLVVARGGRVLFGDLSARVQAGEALVVSGANGVGKSSLLRVVAGLLRPLAGKIVFEGAADDARRGDLHLMGHHDGFKGGRTAREELLFQAAWAGAADGAALRAAERLGVARQLTLEVRRLSAGQRRRLALARLIAAPRSLWLMDESLAPLDADGRALMGEIMGDHLAGGGLILAASHDPLPVQARVLELGA